MAERTHTFCQANFTEGDLKAAYVYDDATGKILRVIITNTHPTKTIEAGVSQDGTGWERTGSWGPNSGETVIKVPPGQQPTLDLVPDGGDPGRDDYYPTITGLTYWMRVV